MEYRLQQELSYTSNSQWQRYNSVRTGKQLRLLKWGIWAYFFFLLFEGALRKWFLPGLATPLLVIRDPIALWLIVSAWYQHRLRANSFLIGGLLIGCIGVITAVLVGHGSLPVALFGARMLLLHFPLIFVGAYCLNRDDLLQMGKVTLWITLPMTVLITLQFFSPQSAWVNLGVAGDTAGAGFSGALGYFRPPATFSFTNGTTLFFSLAACFVFYFWLHPNLINRALLIGATICIIAAIPLSISRALFFQIVISVLFMVMASARNPKFMGKMLLAGLGLLVTLVLLSQTIFFQTSIAAFTDRFTSANENEGGLEGVFIDRFLGGMIGAISGSSELPFFGYGLGMGTNVGAQLLTGERVFLIAEGEWGRVIGELGPLLGIGLVLLRVGLTFQVAIACYKKLQKSDVLPWMLLSFGGLLIAQGGWAQPTALGFFTLMGGLLLSSLRTSTDRKSTN